MSNSTPDSKSYYFTDKMQHALPGILHSPLSVIEAGSGCGKTTLITECFLKRTVPGMRHYIYTCLGESPEKAWEGICTLLQEVDEAVGRRLLDLAPPCNDSITEITLQMGRLSCDDSVILILDNYQLLEFPEPSMFLDALSLHGCGNLHIVVLTHPLKSTVLRHSKNIYVIPSDILSFCPQDIETYFLQAGCKLDGGQIASLYEDSGGFIAAIHLQLIHYLTHGSFIPAVHISKLMEQAIWLHLGKSEQYCYIMLSLLKSFTMEQALSLTKKAGLTERLPGLLSHNPFIRYDMESHLYTIHSLFHTFLEDRFSQWSDIAKKEAWKEAGHACAAAGSYVYAALYYCRAGALQLITSLSFSPEDRIELINLDGHLVVTALIEEPEQQALKAMPELALSLTLELFIQGQYALHAPYYLLVKRLLFETSLYHGRRLEKLLGEFALMESFLAFNDVTAMCACHQKAYSLLQSPTSLYSLKDSFTFASASVVAMFWRKSGQLSGTLTQVAEGMPCYYLLSRNNGRGVPQAMGGETMLLAGDSRGARRLCTQALYEAARYQQDSICFVAETTMARTAILLGEGDSYMDSLTRIVNRGRHGTEHRCLQTCELCQAYLSLILGFYDEIPQWLEDMQAIRRRTLSVTIPFTQIIYGQLMLNKLKSNGMTKNEFERCMEELIYESEQFHMLLPKVYELIYLAIGRDGDGRRMDALDALGQALDLALPDHVYLPFAENYVPLAPLLQIITVRNNKDNIAQVTALGRQFQYGRERLYQYLNRTELPLSKREQEIAWLLSQRLSSREIGEKLGISPNTVRNTIQKIYLKLGIHSKKELYEKRRP